jgi:hypothetical protein
MEAILGNSSFTPKEDRVSILERIVRFLWPDKAFDRNVHPTQWVLDKKMQDAIDAGVIGTPEQELAEMRKNLEADEMKYCVDPEIRTHRDKLKNQEGSGRNK